MQADQTSGVVYAQMLRDFDRIFRRETCEGAAERDEAPAEFEPGQPSALRTQEG